MEFESLIISKQALKKITPLTEHLTVLGIYKKGNTHRPRYLKS